MPRLGQVAVPAERFHEKLCPHCGIFKPLSAFYRSNQKPNPRCDGSKGGKGHDPRLAQAAYCKSCTSVRAADPKMKEKARESRRNYRLSRSLAKYGLTKSSYEEMLLVQGKRCAICGTDQPVGPKNGLGQARFHVDHCHTTGKVRGLLCTNCNSGIGMFDDDVAVMAAAITYIEDSKEK